MEKLKELIAKCVLNGVTFAGAAGTTHTVQDLIHNVGIRNLDTMYKRVQKELKELDTDSLFKSSGSAKKSLLNLQSETLEEVFAYKQAEAERAKNAEATTKRIEFLKSLKTEAEKKRYSTMSEEDIDKEIASLSGTASV